MDAATQAGWDLWIKTHIAVALEDQREKMTSAIGQAMSEYVRKRLTQETLKLREEIGGLRAELTLAIGIQRGEVAKLKGGSRDAAGEPHRP